MSWKFLDCDWIDCNLKLEMAQYGKSEYWEDRYQKDKEPFDWYQRYSGLKDIITQYVQPSFSILNVGAGNSRKSTIHSYVREILRGESLTDTTLSREAAVCS